MPTLKINQTPDMVQPTDAVMAKFDDTRSVTEIGAALVRGGVDESIIWLYEGDEGLDAYEARASGLTKVFDDTAAPIRYHLDDGGAIVIVDRQDGTDLDTISDLLESLGATDLTVFGDWTVVE